MPTGMSRQVDYYLDRAGGFADTEGLYFFLGGGNDLRDATKISDQTQRMLAGSGRWRQHRLFGARSVLRRSASVRDY